MFVNLILLYYADAEMIRAALTPMSPATEFAVAYLINYAEKYSDRSPNSELSYIHCSLRKKVHENYKEFCINNYEEHIGYKAFAEIWNITFPELVARSYVSIPGKCYFCSHIDEIQRQPNSKEAIQDACKRAHQLHSAGMIKLERQRYRFSFLFYYNYLLKQLYNI